jgi:hypothetical protein
MPTRKSSPEIPSNLGSIEFQEWTRCLPPKSKCIHANHSELLLMKESYSQQLLNGDILGWYEVAQK